MRPPQGAEWLLILVIVLLLFGAKRLPDMARGLGRSLRILKAETKGLTEDSSAPDGEAAGAGKGASSAALPSADTTGEPVLDVTEAPQPATSAEDRPSAPQ